MITVLHQFLSIQWCLRFYLGKGIRLSTIRPASGSFRGDYIHLPRNLAYKPFSKLKGHREAIIRRPRSALPWWINKNNLVHPGVWGRGIASNVAGVFLTHCLKLGEWIMDQRTNSLYLRSINLFISPLKFTNCEWSCPILFTRWMQNDHWFGVFI